MLLIAPCQQLAEGMVHLVELALVYGTELKDSHVLEPGRRVDGLLPLLFLPHSCDVNVCSNVWLCQLLWTQ